MKATATIKRVYVKEVEVEFEHTLGLDPIQQATDQVLYTQEVEELFKSAQLREIDDSVDSTVWVEYEHEEEITIKQLNEYNY